MDLDILPPDSEVFHKNEKKPVSTKQKDHLVRAREKARETIERRRKLDRESKEKKNEDEEGMPEPPDGDPEPEPDPEPEEPKKRNSKKKEVQLSEEEIEARRFEKFMKNMNHFEKLKEQKRIDDIEASKIKVSFTKEEYDELLKILDEKDDKAKKEQELKDAIPTAPKKEEVLPQSIYHSLRPRTIPRGRFR